MNELSYFFYTFLLIFISKSHSVSLDNRGIIDAVDTYMNVGDNSIYGPISQWDTSKVTDMRNLFWDDGGKFHYFNRDVSNWNVSKVTDMNGLFYDCRNFNVDLNSWDVGNVTDMSWMLGKMFKFNRNLNNWDVQKVKKMWGMFHNSGFNGDISTWDVGNVTNISDMFWDATSFNVDISSWDVRNAIKMGYMFQEATSFNINISNWNITKTTGMIRMFENASSFHQDLCWDMSNVEHKWKIFKGSNGSLLDYPECTTDKKSNVNNKSPKRGKNSRNELKRKNPKMSKRN